MARDSPDSVMRDSADSDRWLAGRKMIASRSCDQSGGAERKRVSPRNVHLRETLTLNTLDREQHERQS